MNSATVTSEPTLPSVLPSRPALSDITSTVAELQRAGVLPASEENVQPIGKVTNPRDTALFICGLQECCRLYPSKERLMAHRKRDHNSEDDGAIITWND
ncbi:hypothetical protein FISHEDRAFT_37343 [Fistulina hepatica ATCC 64428]|uniref:C2H2-type domain-containing protein n=1 Tax=Fistulina hepatica ATCC 64428 TaxID=1128425 RepID=A0A0D7AKH9_9AGAR|nr:hypothetical protein FISHEDRAFT_37343 [Fistulina hepatica ATCC 64428]